MPIPWISGTAAMRRPCCNNSGVLAGSRTQNQGATDVWYGHGYDRPPRELFVEAAQPIPAAAPPGVVGQCLCGGENDHLAAIQWRKRANPMMQRCERGTRNSRESWAMTGKRAHLPRLAAFSKSWANTGLAPPFGCRYRLPPPGAHSRSVTCGESSVTPDGQWQGLRTVSRRFRPAPRLSMKRKSRFEERLHENSQEMPPFSRSWRL